MAAYFLPFAIYVGLPYLVQWILNDAYTAYAARGLITLPVLIFFLKKYKEIKITWSGVGVILGIVIFFLWTQLDPFYPKLFEDSSVQLDPTPFYYPTLALKFLGMVVVAPWVEELFFRSFLPRYLQMSREWKDVQIGSFTPFTFIASAALFGLIHPQWLPGVLMGFMMNWLFMKTKNLWPCIVAHAVVNFILWEEAIRTQNWALW